MAGSRGLAEEHAALSRAAVVGRVGVGLVAVLHGAVARVEVLARAAVAPVGVLYGLSLVGLRVDGQSAEEGVEGGSVHALAVDGI